MAERIHEAALRRTFLGLSVHSTDPELFAKLSSVLPVEEHDGTRWVVVVSDDVHISFFERRDA